VRALEDRTLPSGAPQLLADVNPGAASSNPSPLVVIGSTAYFAANDGTHGNELWKTDGTAAGTVMLTDISPNDGGVYLSDLTNINGTLNFTFRGSQLWKSKGTAASTVEVASFTGVGDLTNLNGALYFSADDGTHGTELWRSDGTAAGTVMVADLTPGSAGSYPYNLTNVGGKLYFVANDELWTTNGTAAGTAMLTDINANYGGTYLSDLTNVNGTLYFTAEGDQLWKSNGTAAGTVEVAGLVTVSDLTSVNGELFFAAEDLTHGTELWKSDGTAAGTTMVKDINPGTTTTWYYTGSATYTRTATTASSYPSDLTNVNGTLYFSANDGTHGTELWTSDGTAAGTTMVQDLYPGSHLVTLPVYTGYGYFGTETKSATLPNSSNPSNLTNFNGTLLFAANDGTHGNELWEVPAGPRLAISATSTTPTAGQSDSFAISALNADGTPDTTLNGAVTITSSDPRAGYPSSVTLTDGTAQFNVTFETAGPLSVTAIDVQSPGDQGTDGNIVVQAAAASSLTLCGFPSPEAVGTAGTFAVVAYDWYGNVATGYSSTVHCSSSDPKAALPSNATLSNGVGQFSATLSTLGTAQSITATDTQNAAFTATQTGIEVVPFASLSGPSAGAIGQTLTYTIGAGADPAGTVFTVSWGDGSSVQSTATTVGHSYATSATDTVSVTASAAGLSSAAATQAVSILAVAVNIEADPAVAGRQVLVIDGTSGNDAIVLGTGPGSGVTLAFDGTALGDILPTNGAPFALVMVFGEGGNDTIDARGLDVSSVLVGGAGNDTLYGGSARNLLIGGAGADTLYAGSAGDILIGGYTSYDNNLTALAYIMAEWDSTDSYTTRIKKITSGGGLNRSYILNGTTVFDDNTTDGLFAGPGMDWCFAHTRGKNTDRIYGQTSGEVVTQI
jgi:ELWxxDGT repeat protein